MSDMISINPATGVEIARYSAQTPAEIAQAVTRSHEAFLRWRRVPIEERGKHLLRVADVLLAEKDAYARLIAQEMGKPLKEAVAEIEKCAACARYFVENGPRFLADQPIATEYRK
ncbi:MAG: aldehyde dehydrogenase family protein, partial [Pseudomonadota bacterium]|nr:aldehyde dehydrogenase family protein [Pseudomonadota bacterium]